MCQSGEVSQLRLVAFCLYNITEPTQAAQFPSILHLGLCVTLPPHVWVLQTLEAALELCNQRGRWNKDRLFLWSGVEGDVQAQRRGTGPCLVPITKLKA